MPKFAYQAIDPTGDTVVGATKADTIGAARELLLARSLYPVKIEESRSVLSLELTKERVKRKELMNFTRQLAVFVRAGIPITEALVIIGEETDGVALRRTLVSMVDQLRNGGTLSQAAREHPEAFPDFYVGILQSAELTGRLDESLDSLAEYLEREVETRSKITSALAYPMVVVCLAIVTVAILALYVLPQFKDLFLDMDAELPLPTRMLLAVTSLFTDYVYIPAAGLLLLVSFSVWLFRSETGRWVKDRLVVRIPVVRGIIDYSMLERCCRILGAMLRAGVPLPIALRTTTESIPNSVYRERLQVVQDAVLEGAGFARPVAESGMFPGAARQMFKVGEETGTLDQQLQVASSYFDRELGIRIRRFTTMFEPMMIVFVGLLVGFVAIALVSAMYGVLGGMKDSL